MIKRTILSAAAAVALILAASAAAVSRGAADEGKPGAASRAAQPATNPRGETPSLDDELLKDLDRDPLEADLPARAAPGDKRGPTERGAADRSAAGRDKDADALDRELLKGIEEGDDLGAAGNDNPFSRLSREMREVESLMARRRSDNDTQELQSKVVQHLDELIDQAQQQAKNSRPSSGGAGRQSRQSSKRGKTSQPGKRPTDANAEGTAARQSSKKVRDQAAQMPDPADLRELLKGVWGQLPERQRERMLQSYEEQFLPKYEQMISDYFRSIAEESERK